MASGASSELSSFSADKSEEHTDLEHKSGDCTLLMTTSESSPDDHGSINNMSIDDSSSEKNNEQSDSNATSDDSFAKTVSLSSNEEKGDDNPPEKTNNDTTKEPQPWAIFIPSRVSPERQPHLKEMLPKRGMLQTIYCNKDEKEVDFGRGVGVKNDISTYLASEYQHRVDSIHFTITAQLVGASNDIPIYIPILQNWSSTGTFVNRRKLDFKEKVVLTSGDFISILHQNLNIYRVVVPRGIWNTPRILENEYIFVRQLGSGGFGDVHLAFSKKIFQPRAIKVIKKNFFLEDNCEQDSNYERNTHELSILRQLSYPFIVQFWDFKETDSHLYLILEFMECDLDVYLQKSTPPQNIKKLISLEIVMGVKYLNNNRITHRDLKPQNILIKTLTTGLVIAKVTDFGLSKLDKTEMITYCGTKPYMAPKIGESSYSNLVDVWSLGLIIHEILTNELPDLSPRDGYFELSHSDLPPLARVVLEKMLIPDPSFRIDIETVRSCEWFQDPTLLEKLNECVDLVTKQDSI